MSRFMTAGTLETCHNLSNNLTQVEDIKQPANENSIKYDDDVFFEDLGSNIWLI